MFVGSGLLHAGEIDQIVCFPAALPMSSHPVTWFAHPASLLHTDVKVFMQTFFILSFSFFLSSHIILNYNGLFNEEDRQIIWNPWSLCTFLKCLRYSININWIDKWMHPFRIYVQCQLTKKFYQKQHDSIYILSYTIFQTILAGIRAGGALSEEYYNSPGKRNKETRNLRVKIFFIY